MTVSPGVQRRHVKGSPEGGRFKPAPRPDIPDGEMPALPQTAEMTEAEAQDIIDMWLRDDTIMGEWYGGGGNDWIALDCSTKVGPLAGAAISLRVAEEGPRQGPEMYVGEARRMSTNPRGYGPGECLLILRVDPGTGWAHGWSSAEAARAALESVLRNEHDPDSIRMPNIERWVRE